MLDTLIFLKHYVHLIKSKVQYQLNQILKHELEYKYIIFGEYNTNPLIILESSSIIE